MRVRTILFSLFLSSVFCGGVALLNVPTAAAQQAEPPAADVQKPPLTVDEVVSRLVERNREREEALRKFEGTRVYSVKYTGAFGEHSAEMTVNVNYASPDHRSLRSSRSRGRNSSWTTC
jgi:hypothetical protein